LQGIPTGSVADLIEERDGGLWLAASTGIAHVPASVRFPKLKPPRVQLIDLFINGQRVSSTVAPHVPPGRNQIELRFAVLSYRDRSRLRYQFKLHHNDPWTEAGDNLPLFRFYDLGAGKYTLEIRASLRRAPIGFGLHSITIRYARDEKRVIDGTMFFVRHRDGIEERK
jgi:hypothetical protein